MSNGESEFGKESYRNLFYNRSGKASTIVRKDLFFLGKFSQLEYVPLKINYRHVSWCFVSEAMSKMKRSFRKKKRFTQYSSLFGSNGFTFDLDILKLNKKNKKDFKVFMSDNDLTKFSNVFRPFFNSIGNFIGSQTMLIFLLYSRYTYVKKQNKKMALEILKTVKYMNHVQQRATSTSLDVFPKLTGLRNKKFFRDILKLKM